MKGFSPILRILPAGPESRTGSDDPSPTPEAVDVDHGQFVGRCLDAAAASWACTNSRAIAADSGQAAGGGEDRQRCRFGDGRDGHETAADIVAREVEPAGRRVVVDLPLFGADEEPVAVGKGLTVEGEDAAVPGARVVDQGEDRAVGEGVWALLRSVKESTVPAAMSRSLPTTSRSAAEPRLPTFVESTS